MRTLIVALTAFTSLLGCARGNSGHFGDGAYYNPRSHYRIRYVEDQPQVLSSGWTVANFEAGDNGQPAARRDPTSDSGLASFGLPGGRLSQVALPIDLVLETERGDAEIWVRTVVVPSAWQGSPTSAVLNLWAQTLTSAPSSLAPIGAPPAVAIRAQGHARVDGRAARWLDLDVTHRGGRQQRITLVALRTAREWRIGRRRSAPVLLLFGLLSSADRYATARRDFQRLISRVDLQR